MYCISSGCGNVKIGGVSSVVMKTFTQMIPSGA